MDLLKNGQNQFQETHRAKNQKHKSILEQASNTIKRAPWNDVKEKFSPSVSLQKKVFTFLGLVFFSRETNHKKSKRLINHWAA